MNRSFFQFENCLSLNFDYIDVNLSIPQIATTPESELKLTFDFPSSCFFVIVGIVFFPCALFPLSTLTEAPISKESLRLSLWPPASASTEAVEAYRATGLPRDPRSLRHNFDY